MPMSEPSNRFVELGRTFHEVSTQDEHSHLEDDLPYFLQTRPALSWTDLLRNHRVVILSNAGSGKTEELRNTTRKLRTEGKSAFFLRLEHLGNDFENAFEIGSFEKYDKWLTSDEEAWIFLDSVDEARLRSAKDFELAIKKLAIRIATVRNRVHIVITSRPSAWRPKTDRQLCTDCLRLAPAEEPSGPEESTTSPAPLTTIKTVRSEKDVDSTFKIFALDDLSPRQVEIFLRSRNINNTYEFMSAVERADALSLTSRPQDLEELAGFWLVEGRIGTRLELMRKSVARRLTERDQDHADVLPLSLERAHSGAQLLAAAATLARTPELRVPDGSNNPEGLPVPAILPDWNDSEQAALLGRPIFNEASYGTLRFHHRSVREYLTAAWFASLLQHETSRRSIESLLFRNQYGINVIPPTLRPVLPWLAVLDPRIGERIQSFAPEILFEGGDPSRLPIETRRSTLRKVCTQIASGVPTQWFAENTDIQRFINADLADDVRDLFGEYKSNNDVHYLLLRIVWLAELRAALPDAISAALDSLLAPSTRLMAVRAVRSTGTHEDIRRIRAALLSEGPNLSRALVGELIYEVEPTHEIASWLAAVLPSTGSREAFGVDKLSSALTLFLEAADAKALSTLLRCFDRLLSQEPLIDSTHRGVSRRFRWMLRPLSTTLLRIVGDRYPEALGQTALRSLRRIARASRYQLEELQNDEAMGAISAGVRAWPELNRTLFWYDVQESRVEQQERRGDRLTDFWPVSVRGAFWQFDEADFDYVAEKVSSQAQVDDRLVALSLAFWIYVKHGRPRRWRERLKTAVASDKKVAAQLQAYLHPPPQTEQERLTKRRIAAMQRRSSTKKRERDRRKEEWRVALTRDVDAIRAPQAPCSITDAQYYLLRSMRGADSASMRWAAGSWRSLIGEFGEAVAEAFRDAAIAYWRRCRPRLRSEGAPQNETPYSVILGLTGIGFEASETPNWPLMLDAEDIGILCRYASHEINGFPDWFPDIFHAHSNQVRRFLCQEIEHELFRENHATPSHYILSDVRWSGEWAWNHIAPSLVDFLRSREPGDLADLRNVLRIIHGSTVSDQHLALLCSERVRAAQSPDHLALWFAVWTGVDPMSAIPAFATSVASLLEPEHRTTFAMNYVTSLLDGVGNRGIGVRGAFRAPGHLKELYLLIHRYVRRVDDIDRTGTGVYTPGLRDDAQSARDALLQLLQESPGKESYLALTDIARSHSHEASGPWLLSNARAKAQMDADVEPWSPSQVREFHASFERTPATHRELADLATKRFLDLKDEIEHGDQSAAQLLRRVQSESELRNYIARELRANARGRYTISQEEELADAKRPDMRFHGAGFDGPVPVELKLAENWTGPSLCERLENQLCRSYLRDGRSSRGLFVLVVGCRMDVDARRHWQVPHDARRLDFLGLIAGLRAHWERVAGNFEEWTTSA